MKGIYFAGNFLSKTIEGTRSTYEEIAERFAKLGWFVVTASSQKNRILRMIDFLWTALIYRRKYQVASVAVFSDLAFRWAEVLCFFFRLINKPYILSLHGGKLPEFAQNNFSRVSKLLKSAKIVTTPSKFILNRFISIRDDMLYVPNGIDINNYKVRIISHVKPKIVWLRSFHNIYSPTTAVEVMAKIVEDYPDATLVMIGPDKKDGSYERTIRIIDQKNLKNNVKVINAIPKSRVPYLLSTGDIFLNTTIYESFGVSVLEAAACGLCIVTTNVGELPYMWENGVDALLVPPSSYEPMAAAVKQILTDSYLGEKLSINARMKAEQFDWSVILPKWEALFDSLLQDE